MSSFETARMIYKENGLGLNGLNRGLTSTLGRHGIWNAIYFGFYHNIRVYIPKTDVINIFFYRHFKINLNLYSINKKIINRIRRRIMRIEA